MADFQIPDKDQLTSVDRAADSLLIYDSDASALKRSTVNNLTDLTSHPVGIDDVQTLTNKTLTAPTISSSVLSGTITGTYTIGGTPTFPSSVVTLTGSQTLTNKVLTSPTINTATISNPTLNTDAVNEFTSANGVTVDGLNIKDSKLNTNNSVVTANITDSAVTTAKINDDAVTDAKLIYGKLRSRQGGSATNWTTSGTTTYDYSGTTTFIQAGARSGNGNTITFPTAFNQVPLVFVTVITAGTQNTWARVSATTTTTFTYQIFINNTTNGTSETISWMAIGE